MRITRTRLAGLAAVVWLSTGGLSAGVRLRRNREIVTFGIELT